MTYRVSFLSTIIGGVALQGTQLLFIGVLLSKFNVYIPAESLRKLYQLNDDSTGAIFIYLKDLKDVPAVQARLRKSLAAESFGVMEDSFELVPLGI